jgi:hypothetical protein
MTDEFMKAIEDIQKALLDGVRKNYLAGQLAALDKIADEQEPEQVATLERLGMSTDEARKNFLQAKEIAREFITRQLTW